MTVLVGHIQSALIIKIKVTRATEIIGCTLEDLLDFQILTDIDQPVIRRIRDPQTAIRSNRDIMRCSKAIELGNNLALPIYNQVARGRPRNIHVAVGVHGKSLRSRHAALELANERTVSTIDIIDGDTTAASISNQQAALLIEYHIMRLAHFTFAKAAQQFQAGGIQHGYTVITIIRNVKQPAVSRDEHIMRVRIAGIRRGFIYQFKRIQRLRNPQNEQTA